MEDPDESSPSGKGQKGQFRSATPALLELWANHPHTRKDSVDKEIKESRADKNVGRPCINWKI